uniref:Uncharacterized protein n=1 Tax=Utricularia reniformis TaxID=192314 RepID=A0A1Y0B386_9LAMI|nr:hypothetical protein AEK19_MT1676 [Utricularia reniformis]ART31858.1 hypothetical protein AEK19_MT1676 [Utricularia reniformis]
MSDFEHHSTKLGELRKRANNKSQSDDPNGKTKGSAATE